MRRLPIIVLCHFCIFHGVVNNFPGLWGTGISDAIFFLNRLIQFNIMFSFQQVLKPLFYINLNVNISFQ